MECRKQRPQHKNLWKVVYLGFAFLVLFSAYYSAMNLQAIVWQNNGYGSLGFYNLALVSVVCALFSLLSPMVIAKTGIKLALILSAIGNGLFILNTAFSALKLEADDQ